MRQSPTPSEALFWQHCRNRKLGDFKFRRQHVFFFTNWRGDSDFYIVDFYSHSHRLVIEIDGSYHETEFQKELDEERSQILQQTLGLTILRFTNEEVFNDIDRVKKSILGHIRNNKFSDL